MQNDSPGFENVTVVGDFQCEVGVLFHQQNLDAERLIDLDDFFKNRLHQSYPLRMSHSTQARGT